MHTIFMGISQQYFSEEGIKGFKTPVEAGNTRFTSEVENIWNRLQLEMGREK